MIEGYEWDEVKADENRRNHGISFEEATEIFHGPMLTKVDDRHDYGELREISFGLLGSAVVLVVTHTERNGATRIISARKAIRPERKLFYDYLEKTLG